MPRYYFHIAKPLEILHDAEGVELSSSLAALEAVFGVIEELRGSESKQDENFDDYYVNIVDETGALVASLPLKEISSRMRKRSN